MGRVRIEESPSMEGVKVGLYFPSRNTIFVSQTIMKLCKSDLALMRKNLRIYVMPQEENKDKFDSVESWLAFLICNNEDILSKE